MPVMHAVGVTTDLGPLARELKARRLYLGYSQADVKRHGGPSLVTVRDIERGRQTVVRDLTLAGLDRALRWESGSAERVMQGGRPTPLPEPKPTERNQDHAPITTAVQHFPDGLRIVRTVYEEIGDDERQQLERDLEVFVRTWQAMRARDADEGNGG